MQRKAPAVTQENRRKRRNEIMLGLYRCILKNGYLNTTVRDIAKEADINSGLIHHYFDSKEDILFFLMEKILARYKDQVAKIAGQESGQTPLERLKGNIELMFKKMSRDKDAYIIFYELFTLSRQHENLSKLLRVIYREFRKEVETLITTCFVQENLDTAQVKNVSAFLVSVIEGAGTQWMIDPKSISIPKIAVIINQFMDFYIQQSKIS